MNVIAKLVALDLAHRRTKVLEPVRISTKAEATARVALRTSLVTHTARVADAVGVRPC